MLIILSVSACAAEDAGSQPLPTAGASAGDLYKIRPLSEQDLMRVYTDMLTDGCRYSDASWHTSTFDPGAGYWGDGSTRGNSGPRAVTSMVLACGALLRYCDALTPADRANFLAKSTAAIRFLTATHVTGSQTCVDGKKWGNAWGSAYETGEFCFGALLMWDSLDPSLKADVQRVIAYEANRFLNVSPPNAAPGDTKAEENAWNQYGISLAPILCPSDPNVAAWDWKAIEYAMNTFSVAQDKQDSTIVDGRPVSGWVCTENIHSDFTLENHHILHPSYMQCSIYLLMPSVMSRVYSNRAVPQGYTHHIMDVWGVFQGLLLPSGETAFPQGMDWEMHNLPAINLFANLATYKHDPVAAKAEKTIIQYMRAWQEEAKGSLTVPGSTLGFTRHSIQCEQVATAYLAHKLFGPATDAPAPATPGFVKYYDGVEDLFHRTSNKLLSFSWKNHIMGTILPIGPGHEGNPFFTAPITNGLVGTTTLSAGGTKVTVAEHTWRAVSGGCETSGVLSTNDGLLQQQIKVTSLGDKTVVYQDLVTAKSKVSVTKELGVPIGIENDSISGGARTVYYQGGQSAFDWKSPKPTFAIPGKWANADDRFGAVMVAGSGMAYTQATDYARGIALYEDVLSGSYSDSVRSFDAGAIVARRTLVFFTEVTAKQTSALAKSIKVESGPNGPVLVLKLPEGGSAVVQMDLNGSAAH